MAVNFITNFITELLFSHMFWYFGFPEDIVSNWGPQFTLKVWASFIEKLGITISLTSGYQPQANRQVEKANQEIGQFLCTFCVDYQEDWAQFLQWAEYAAHG